MDPSNQLPTTPHCWEKFPNFSTRFPSRWLGTHQGGSTKRYSSRRRSNSRSAKAAMLQWATCIWAALRPPRRFRRWRVRWRLRCPWYSHGHLRRRLGVWRICSCPWEMATVRDFYASSSLNFGYSVNFSNVASFCLVFFSPIFVFFDDTSSDLFRVRLEDTWYCLK